jgi:hypothetical protein
MALLAPASVDHLDVYSLISKWTLKVEGGKKSESEFYLQAITGVATRALREIVRLAFNGNKMAADELHRILSSKVSAFDKLCHQHPELYEGAARKTTVWPAFISCDADIKKRNEKLLKMLNLGCDSGLNYSGKQWSRDTPEVSVALELWGIMNVYRKSWLDQPAQTKLIQAEWRRINKSLGRPANYRPPPFKPQSTTPELKEKFRLMSESSNLAKELQPLNRQNYKQWFAASWPVFLARYRKDFENRTCFSDYWKSPAYKNKLHARAMIRDAIKKKIRQAFRSIAPKSS